MYKIFIVLLLLIWSQQTRSQDSLLQELKYELTRDKVYDQEKRTRITTHRQKLQLAEPGDFDTQYQLCRIIFEEYRSFKFDSAFVYVRKMILLSEHFHKDEELITSKLMLGGILLNSGFHKEAFDILREIHEQDLHPTLRTAYLLLRSRLHAGIAEYDNDAHFAPNYRRQSIIDYKNAQTATPANAFEQTIDLAFLPAHKNLSADFFYNTILDQRLTAHGIAMVATRVSYAFSGRDRIRFLTLAAINDIRSSTKETLAIFLLGQELFKMNRLSEAYDCLEEASSNAKFYGARNRAVQIESMLPLVAGKLIDQQQHEKDKLVMSLLAFLIVAIVLFFLLVDYRKKNIRIRADEEKEKEKNKALEMVNQQLSDASRIKEGLIGIFIKTCASYIQTLDKVKHQSLHSLKLGKYKDVNQLLSKVQIEEQKGELYHMLDSVFLTMFPDFITSFNALLKEEDQIWPKSGETLTATLRIFALIRLGIHEHEAIAQILNYSVSTVYTYKTRVKSRALVSPNDFEQRIMELK